MSAPCPFCTPAPARTFLETEQVIAMWDAHPVSPGHALLIPRRHVADWFSATDAERTALAAATVKVRREIERLHSPDGYNIGINVGEAAGQSVFHLHLHVIPRYRGDVPQPRGGIRGVIPWRCDYTEKP